MVNSVFIKRIRVVKQAVQLLLLLLATSERWRGGGLLRQAGGDTGDTGSLTRMMHSKGVGQKSSPLEGTSPLEVRDMLGAPADDTSRVLAGLFFCHP